uniref:Uncharacterized protein n=1 Tax=Manihot esculenta TaxID=3983 RepID=A0A2C9UAZ3_MANES
MNGTKLKIFPIEFYSDVSITDFLFINASPSFVKQMVEEAGGTVTRMDGGKFCVFDRSVLVSNGVMHAKLLERIAPTTEKLKAKGIDFSLWYKPENYPTDF